MSTTISIFPYSLTSLRIKPPGKSQTFVFNPYSRMAISKPKDGSCFLGDGGLRNLGSGKGAQRELVVYNSVQPGSPLPSEPTPPNSWKGWILGTLITFGLPFLWNKWGSFFKLSKDIEATVERAEHVTEVIEKVAEEVEKVAEEVSDEVPEGGKIRGAIEFVENVAKETVKDANLAEEIIDKVQEVEKEVESSVEQVNDKASGTADEAKDQK